MLIPLDGAMVKHAFEFAKKLRAQTLTLTVENGIFAFTVPGDGGILCQTEAFVRERTNAGITLVHRDLKDLFSVSQSCFIELYATHALFRSGSVAVTLEKANAICERYKSAQVPTTEKQVDASLLLSAVRTISCLKALSKAYKREPSVTTSNGCIEAAYPTLILQTAFGTDFPSTNLPLQVLEILADFLPTRVIESESAFEFSSTSGILAVPKPSGANTEITDIAGIMKSAKPLCTVPFGWAAELARLIRGLGDSRATVDVYTGGIGLRTVYGNASATLTRGDISSSHAASFETQLSFLHAALSASQTDLAAFLDGGKLWLTNSRINILTSVIA